MYKANHIFFTVRISANQSRDIHVQLVGWLFHTLQTLANECLSNYHINMLSSIILSLDFRLFLLETLWSLRTATLLKRDSGTGVFL